ncbi:hypothetical protein HDU93_000701 [Gonapodya sp. JEL0774]|nr:hypothetical protein HDU93_000701 [Gonapodya sp. JEL0774]
MTGVSSSRSYSLCSRADPPNRSLLPLSQHPSSTLSLLPAEVILLIGVYLDFRLGLPTGALDRHLASIFATPNNIAARAIARYKPLMEAVVWECLNSSTGDSLVVKAIYDRSNGRPDFNLDWTGQLNRGNKKHQIYTITPLRAAIKAGNPAVVRYLLDLGANVDISSRDNREVYTALIEACSTGHLETVKMLLDRGADIHFQHDGALRMASRCGNVEIVQLLLSKGANLEPREYNVEGCSALCEAAEFGRSEVVLELLSHGADIHVFEDYPLLVATVRDHLDTVRLLLSKGADVGTRDNEAICVAAQLGLVEMMCLLLDRGADVNAQNGSPLRYAEGSGRWDLVSLLLRRSPNVQFHENKVLWNAVASGKTDVVKQLLELGADPRAPSQYKMSAVYRAKRLGHNEIIKLISRTELRAVN